MFSHLISLLKITILIGIGQLKLNNTISINVKNSSELTKCKDIIEMISFIDICAISSHS